MTNGTEKISVLGASWVEGGWGMVAKRMCACVRACGGTELGLLMHIVHECGRVTAEGGGEGGIKNNTGMPTVKQKGLGRADKKRDGR